MVMQVDRGDMLQPADLVVDSLVDNGVAVTHGDRHNASECLHSQRSRGVMHCLDTRCLVLCAAARHGHEQLMFERLTRPALDSVIRALEQHGW